MFGVAQMTENTTPSKPAVRRARPVHSCLDCRSRKLKCDRARPCGQCVKAGRPDDCHYDSAAGSMSRNLDADDDEPANKRLRTEDGEVTGQNTWSLYAPAQTAYGAYGTSDSTSQRNGSIGAIGTMVGHPGAQQAFMGGNAQRYSDPSDGQVQAIAGTRDPLKLGIMEDLQSRVARLEKIMDEGNRAEDNAHSSRTGAAEVLVDLKHSHSSAINPKRSILYQFEDTRKFYHECIQNSNGMDEVHRLRAIFPKVKQPTRKHINSSEAMSTVIEMIPPSGDCDRLLKIYLNTWDPIHQMLDLGNFINDYSKFWRQSPEEKRNAFAPALLLVTAIGSSLDDASQSQNPTFLYDTVSYVDTWLADLSNKRQKDIEVLSVHALLVIAMQCAAITPDRIYRMSGSLVRSAMLMGLHYDPRVVQRQADDRQIQHRRNLWTSIVELDLQAALQVGMPPCVRDTDLRINATVLANDDAGDGESPYTRQHPSATNIDSESRSQQAPPLQITLARSLKTRLLSAALTLDVYPTQDFTKMRQKIHLPTAGSMPPTLSHMIADTYVQRSIIATTRAQVKIQGQRVVEGSIITANSAMTILNHLYELDPNCTPGLASKRMWSLYVSLFGNDVYRSALVCCFIRKVANSFPPYNGSVGNYSGEALIIAADECLHRLLKNLDDLGNHIRDLLALTLAIESVRPEAQKDETTKLAALKNGFERLKQRLYERRPMTTSNMMVGAGMNGSGQAETSPQTGSSNGQTPLGDFDFQFLANSFNFDLDFGFGDIDPALAAGSEIVSQQAMNYGSMPA